MPSLLLVDDHPVVHVALEAALIKSSRPYRLQAVQDDVQALAQLAAADFALVILDIGLPKVDGLQLLKKIRRHYPQQPILIYTAQEEEIYARMAYAAGANGFVHKGSRLEQLVQAIETVLGGELSFPAAAMAEDTPADRGLAADAKRIAGSRAAQQRVIQSANCRDAEHQQQNRQHPQKEYFAQDRRQ